ncbi:MAG: hypothetical protein QMD09_15205, partial [Desulfatibacillaceae bacterium]|nr:hypothetical protein [Desulfatibacillaceae bacterium]
RISINSLGRMKKGLGKRQKPYFIPGKGFFMNAMQYCDKVNRQLVGFKAGVYDILEKMEGLNEAEKSVYTAPIKDLKGIIAELDAGLAALKNACPADWSPQKAAIDAQMEELSATLLQLAAKIKVSVPDTTSWT